MKTIGAAGLGSVFASAQTIAGPDEPNATGKTQEPKFPQVPRRKLGKTGVEVPCLSLGGGVNFIENQIILRKAFQWGVNYWHTANNYMGGNSELGIGKFLSQNPELRKELFIASEPPRVKDKPDAANMENCLATSLKRMKTNYVDWYGVHALSAPAQLTDELKDWVKSAKDRKLIKYFGFTTHANMAQCLAAAVRLDWIDAIITSYNFRLMQDAEMQVAIEACHKAGIGLIAMKVVGLSLNERSQLVAGRKIETEEDEKLLRHFLKQGLTNGQAKIKFVLEDKRINSACVGVKNIALLSSNVAAVLDKTKLTQTDRAVFKEYAEATCSGYCAGCAYICDSALPDAPYVSDIMRYLMYYNSYGEKETARELFAKIPGTVRNKLLSIDYSLAEARCPQHMPIGKLVAEAVSKLA